MYRANNIHIYNSFAIHVEMKLVASLLFKVLNNLTERSVYRTTENYRMFICTFWPHEIFLDNRTMFTYY